MKKRLLLIIMGLCFVLAGCGSKNETETLESSGAYELSGEVIDETDEGKVESSSVEDVVESSEMTQKESVEIQFSTEHMEGKSDPNLENRKYEYSYDIPHITIVGNDEATNKIQGDLQKQIDRFVASLDDEDFGFLFEGAESDTNAYQNLTVTLERADDKVITLCFALDFFNMGAHGSYSLPYYNYYTQTGERITFDSLGKGFREKAEELVLEKAKEMNKKDAVLFDGYENSIPAVVLDGTENPQDVFTKIYGAGDYSYATAFEPTFFLSESGFGFISGDGVLQPHAAGILTFEVDASEFAGVLTADVF